MQEDKDTEMQTPAGDRIWVVATLARIVVPREKPLRMAVQMAKQRMLPLFKVDGGI